MVRPFLACLMLSIALIPVIGDSAGDPTNSTNGETVDTAEAVDAADAASSAGSPAPSSAPTDTGTPPAAPLPRPVGSGPDDPVANQAGDPDPEPATPHTTSAADQAIEEPSVEESTAIDQPSSETNPPSQTFGFSPGGWFADEDDAALFADLDRMVEAGGTWIRLDFDWSEIERNQGTLHWHRTDRVVEAARSRGLEVLGLITESPGWSRGNEFSAKSPPNDPREYARFAAAAVERYGPRGVTTWELWNEPNHFLFWGPKPNPEGYAELVRPAAEAMRAVDPGVTILSGGLSPAADRQDGSEISPMTFIARMFEAGADVFDGIAIHPFSYPARPIDPDSAAWNPFHNLPTFRDLLESYGQGDKPIWLTEYGAPTGTSARAVSEAEQAAQVVEALRVVDGWDWTGPILFYSHRDFRWAPEDFQSNFGLMRNDGTPKQAWLDLLALTGR